MQRSGAALTFKADPASSVRFFPINIAAFFTKAYFIDMRNPFTTLFHSATTLADTARWEARAMNRPPSRISEQ